MIQVTLDRDFRREVAAHSKEVGRRAASPIPAEQDSAAVGLKISQSQQPVTAVTAPDGIRKHNLAE